MERLQQEAVAHDNRRRLTDDEHMEISLTDIFRYPTIRTLERLAALSREEDPSRPPVLASCSVPGLMRVLMPALVAITSIAAAW